MSKQDRLVWFELGVGTGNPVDFEKTIDALAERLTHEQRSQCVVKFQIHDPDATYALDAASDVAEMLRARRLTWGPLLTLADHAKRWGFQTGCSAFSFDGLRGVVGEVELGRLDWVKVGAGEATNKAWSAALSGFGGNLAVSLGALSFREWLHWRYVWSHLKGPQRRVLNHCVSSYPAGLLEVRASLHRLGALREFCDERSHCTAGFSCHADAEATLWAAFTAGAESVEFHVAAVSGAFGDPDASVSVPVSLAAELAGEWLDWPEQSLRTNETLDDAWWARHIWIAAADIAEGDELKVGVNLATTRVLDDELRAASAPASRGFYRPAVRAYRAGEPIDKGQR